MPYNDELAVRMSAIFNENNHIIEKKMFGGVGYLLNGNMVCGILQDHLILRLEPKEAERYLSKPGYEPFMNHANAKTNEGVGLDPILE